MAKHRGAPVFKYRIYVIESERGWGRDEWEEDYDTYAEAQDAIDRINAANTSAVTPDYYIMAMDRIDKVQL